MNRPLTTLYPLGLDKVTVAGAVAVDTETSGLFVDEGARVSTVSVAFKPMFPSEFPVGQVETEDAIITSVDLDGVRIVSMAWPFDQGLFGTGKPEDSDAVLFGDSEANLSPVQYTALTQWLQRQNLVMHHAKFDCHIFAAGLRTRPSGVDLIDRVVWDTQNVAHYLWPQHMTASLKPTAEILWGAQESDEQKVIKEYLRSRKLPNGRWDLMPWPVIAKYADKDAQMTLRLYLHQRALVDKMGPTASDHVERRLEVSRLLYRMEQRGLPFDVRGSLTEARILEDRLDKIKATLPFDTLPKAKKFWFEDCDIAPYERTASGAPAVNASVIDRMAQDGVEFAAEWRELQKGSTALDRWYQGYPDLAGPDGRLRGSVRQNGTVSGRFSIERVQLQAIPQDYRLSGHDILAGLRTPRQLIASGVPDGLRMFELDLANAELRVAAMFAKCRPMLEQIYAGNDLHGYTAQQLFDVQPDDDDWDKMRQVAKRGNFSLIFGSGAETFQEMVYKQAGIDLSLRQARQIVRSWNDLYPEFGEAIHIHMNGVERRKRENDGWGWISTYNGEKRWYGLDRKNKTYPEDTHSAFNQRVQANLAQFALDWWLKIERAGRLTYGDEPHPEYGHLGLVMCVHDSAILLITDDEIGHLLVRAAKELGEEHWARTFKRVPGGVDVKEFGK